MQNMIDNMHEKLAPSDTVNNRFFELQHTASNSQQQPGPRQGLKSPQGTERNNQNDTRPITTWEKAIKPCRNDCHSLPSDHWNISSHQNSIPGAAGHPSCLPEEGRLRVERPGSLASLQSPPGIRETGPGLSGCGVWNEARVFLKDDAVSLTATATRNSFSLRKSPAKPWFLYLESFWESPEAAHEMKHPKKIPQ